MNTKFIIASILGIVSVLSIGSLSDHTAGASGVPGTCNASLTITEVSVISTTYPTLADQAQKADHNGNGWVCYDINNLRPGNSHGPVAAIQDDRF